MEHEFHDVKKFSGFSPREKLGSRITIPKMVTLGLLLLEGDYHIPKTTMQPTSGFH